jgi:hypothetical protein
MDDHMLNTTINLSSQKKKGTVIYMNSKIDAIFENKMMVNA